MSRKHASIDKHSRQMNTRMLSSIATTHPPTRRPKHAGYQRQLESTAHRSPSIRHLAGDVVLSQNRVRLDRLRHFQSVLSPSKSIVERSYTTDAMLEWLYRVHVIPLTSYRQRIMPYMAHKACQNTIPFFGLNTYIVLYHTTGNETVYNKADWISIQKIAYLATYILQ